MPISESELPDVAATVGGFFRGQGLDVADATVEDLIASAADPKSNRTDGPGFGELLAFGGDAFEIVKVVMDAVSVVLTSATMWQWTFGNRTKPPPAPKEAEEMRTRLVEIIDRYRKAEAAAHAKAQADYRRMLAILETLSKP